MNTEPASIVIADSDGVFTGHAEVDAQIRVIRSSNIEFDVIRWSGVGEVLVVERVHNLLVGCVDLQSIPVALSREVTHDINIGNYEGFMCKITKFAGQMNFDKLRSLWEKLSYERGG